MFSYFHFYFFIIYFDERTKDFILFNELTCFEGEDNFCHLKCFPVFRDQILFYKVWMIILDVKLNNFLAISMIIYIGFFFLLLKINILKL